jgi:hypothetical protein
VFGGTGALLSGLGLGGVFNTCSSAYQTGYNIGSLDMTLEVGAAGGAAVEGGVDALGGLQVAGLKLGPIIAPLAGGAAGGVFQSLASGHTPTLSTLAQGAAGGLAGEFATGFVPGTSAAGAAGAVNTAFHFVW